MTWMNENLHSHISGKCQKNGREPDDAELVSLSKRLVENAVLKAVQQYIEESQAKARQTDGILLEASNSEKTENNTVMAQ
ncbi:hypothetical protein XELAEV_18026972mg [Xenopus laevis]|uniref:A-kinase anchor protein 7 RI-RII subunit-binding domain-containing protein n=1 Tax=Xenopus laevis TaxID=8355 RepID=A0A974CVE9_XENLA|nr:hypothetical protein XELAEV_18026972mg [Xenopus laevis]